MQNTNSSGPHRPHILTIALEDYFHGPAFRGLIHPKSWGRFESRYEKSALAALDLLAKSQSRATFFVNDWVARQRTDVLAEVLRQGHEIALSGERSFRFLNPPLLREKLHRAKCIVEEACGHSVFGYRQSDTLLRPRDLWAFEVLAEEGFIYDSSLSPAGWAFRKQPWRRFVHKEVVGLHTVWEFPLSSQSVSGLMIPFAGGNYFRQYPESLVRWSIKRWERNCLDPLVLYFRLWDLDPAQPHIHTGSFVRELRHYRNSTRMVRMIGELFEQFRFQSIAGSLGLDQTDTKYTLTTLPAEQRYQPLTGTTSATLDAEPVAVSVIVPCFNEEATIPYLARALDELRSELEPAYDVQFILIDDGSSDQTWAGLNQQFGARRDTLLIRHDRNRGVAAAISTGLEHARDIACSMDCDCSYDPRELKPMLGLLKDDVDLVTASPYHPKGRVSNVPSWRIGLSRSASLLYQIVTGRKLYTFTSCLRVYRRAAALATPLKHGGFLGVAELAGKFALSGRNIVEHPATLQLRLFGRSKMKIPRVIAGHLGLLASLARSRFIRPNLPAPQAEEFSASPPADAKTSKAIPVTAGINQD